MTTRPIAVTPGEPAGIGPDILLKTIAEGCQYPLVAIADLALLQQRASLLKLSVTCVAITNEELNTVKAIKGVLPVLNVPLKAPVNAGQLDAKNGRYVIDTLDVAIDLAMSGLICALATGPVQKSVINEAGIAFTGHTEYLQHQTNTEEVVMMLATEGLRVALVTTHLPLKDISAAITEQKIIQVATILNNSLIEDFGCKDPNVLVTGLNPHAGEDGHLGREEIDTIIPALSKLSRQNVFLKGPLPADTLFQPHYLDTADAVLAMYHDQGLPVLKYKGFGNAVNITLGLPFIRTSVDHGTALDLAGTGNANIGSLTVALTTAWNMAKHRDQHHA